MKNDEKVTNETKSKKKLFIIIGAITIAIIAAILVLVLFVFKDNSNEKELVKNMEKLGGQFYEEFYYPAQEKAQKDVKEFIKKFENSGIKVNLENIAKFSKIDKKIVDSMVNSETNKKCDQKETYIIIKPTSPYGKKNYKIDVTLSCGFKEDTKKKAVKKANTNKPTKVVTKAESKRDITSKKTTKK